MTDMNAAAETSTIDTDAIAQKLKALLNGRVRSVSGPFSLLRVDGVRYLEVLVSDNGVCIFSNRGAHFEELPAGLTMAQIADHIVNAAMCQRAHAIGTVTVATGTGWRTYQPAA